MTVVYRLYDSDDHLLYVGKTRQLAVRIEQHRRRQPWGDEIARHEAKAVTSQAEAEALELRWIVEMAPAHNKQLPNGEHTDPFSAQIHFKVPRDFYEAFAAKALGDWRTVNQQTLKLMTEYLSTEEEEKAA